MAGLGSGNEEEVLENGIRTQDLESFYRSNEGFQAKIKAQPPNITEASLKDVKSSLTDLNKAFIQSCTQNIREVGYSASLVPGVADYIRASINILSQLKSKEGLLETGQILQELNEHYFAHLFNMENRQSQPHSLPSTGTELKSDKDKTQEFNLFSNASNKKTTDEPKEVNPVISEAELKAKELVDRTSISAFNFQHPPMVPPSLFKAKPAPAPAPPATLASAVRGFQFGNSSFSGGFSSSTSPVTTAPNNNQTNFSFGTPPSNFSNSSKSQSTFSFGTAGSGGTSITNSTFFTLPTQQTSTFTPSFMTSSSVGSNSIVQKPNASAEEDEDEKAEKEAQNHEMTRIIEDDAIFSIKCKVYDILKEKPECVVRGLGVLYLKKIPDGGYQVLVRADNASGKVVLNIKLDSDIMNMTSLNKNGIYTVDPHAKTKILIRVKTQEDSKKLFEEMQKCCIPS